MVSTRSLISTSSSPSINPLVTVPRVPITIGITVIFMFHSFFNSLARSKYLSFFLFSFTLTLKSAMAVSSLLLLLLLRLVVCPWLGDPFVLQNPESSVCLILLDRFLVVRLLFVHMVKFPFLAQFLVNSLIHQAVLSLMLFLREFVALVYNAIDHFVSIIM